MSCGFKLSHRIARLRAPILAGLILAVACDSSEPLDPDSSITPDAVDQTAGGDAPLGDAAGEVEIMTVGEPELASASFAGGIPIGLHAQPVSLFNGTYNGSLNMIFPQYLLTTLAAIKARGGRVFLNMSAGRQTFTNSDGTFNLGKWKAQIDKYRNINFESYIRDGTIIGHYMIDEPHHQTKYGGKPISPSTLEEMAQYSKARYPGMATVARTWPEYLERGGPYRYLDAAWAAYAYRFGPVDDFIAKNVASAKRQGLGLVVGLHVSQGSPSKGRMTASQIRDWGTVLLRNTYPCAFISWKYESDYLRANGIDDAFRYLRNMAENRSTTSCRGS
jgi:hypothetical protein